MTRWTALLLLCFCLVLPAAAEVRLALVIDQTNYQHTSELSRVTLASSEADQIEAALKDTGFKVTRHRDLTSADLREALDAFRLSLENAGPEAVGFLYYTGHGAQHPQSRNSFLLGTEARLRGASDLAAYGVALETQRDAFATTGAKAIILVFDACRNAAPAGGYKSAVKGISLLEAKADMLIAYSTDLDEVAAEGIYAPILAEEIRRPGQTAETVFANVQRQVAQRTQREQLPWFDPRLYETICLAKCDAMSAFSMVDPPDLGTSSVEMLAYRSGYDAFEVQDYAQAREKFSVACYGKLMQGCVALGALYQGGFGTKPDYSEARNLYQMACEGDDLTGCVNLGTLYTYGFAVERDFDKAEILFGRACDAAVQIGCVYLGKLYDAGQGVLQDHEKAASLYKPACDAGESLGCVYPGALYYSGQGVPQDYTRAGQLYQQSCWAGEPLGCAYLGLMYQTGRDVEQNYKEAMRLFQRACNAGETQGCTYSGLLHYNGFGVPKNNALALQIFESSCETNEAQGCTYLGVMNQRGDGVPRNLTEARKYYTLGCELGHATGCKYLEQSQSPN